MYSEFQSHSYWQSLNLYNCPLHKFYHMTVLFLVRVRWGGGWRGRGVVERGRGSGEGEGLWRGGGAVERGRGSGEVGV